MVRRGIFHLVIWMLLGVCVRGASRDCFENAAYHYLKAAALVPNPRTAEQFDMLMFARTEMRDLPPQGFNAWPEAARWLLRQDAVLEALARATRCKRCVFDISREPSPTLRLDHLGVMRRLIHYGMAVSKAYEYAQNPRTAAEIYGYLLRLIFDLDQDRNLNSALVAVDELQLIMDELVPFLERTDDADAALRVMRVLRTKSRPAFHLGEYLREESRRFSRWLLMDPDAAVEKLNRLYGQQEHRPAVDRLLAVEGAEREELLRRWVMDYESRMIRLADAVERPYLKGISIVRTMDRHRETLVRAGGSLPAGANPLVPLLQPSMERVYQRMLLAEGQIEALRLLCAASIYRSGKGRWPLSTAELYQGKEQRVPRDPFSGQELYYRLVRSRPRIVIRVPRWMARGEMFHYIFDLSEIRERQQRNLESLVKRIRLTAAGQATPNVPVPAGR
ncbi:MAG TPA: hypothetical protein ENG36_00730 [Lentisphaerae bacterium]|nr:hypothetical protein [Lentisphaerota bacterium]